MIKVACPHFCHVPIFANNWQNSPNRYGNENLIYNGNGDTTGYSVPNSSGGINMYDFEGNRTGYVPSR